jgi:curved DNA-binding protein
MAFIDYYKVLGSIKRQRKLRLKAFKMAKISSWFESNDKEAERKFKELNEANEVLSSTEVKKYDEYGENWQNAEQYEQSKDNSNTTNEVDNKLISVAVERIIRFWIYVWRALRKRRRS